MSYHLPPVLRFQAESCITDVYSKTQGFIFGMRYSSVNKVITSSVTLLRQWRHWRHNLSVKYESYDFRVRLSDSTCLKTLKRSTRSRLSVVRYGFTRVPQRSFLTLRRNYACHVILVWRVNSEYLNPSCISCEVVAHLSMKSVGTAIALYVSFLQTVLDLFSNSSSWTWSLNLTLHYLTKLYKHVNC